MPNTRLTLRQQRFIAAYLGPAGGNATEAARLAGYHGNRVTLAAVGSENLRKPLIQADLGDRIEGVIHRKADSQSLSQALEKLPANFREVLVLREMEGLSYKEIAYVVGIPIGTVMSGLARARERLRQSLSHLSNSGGLSRSASASQACRE